MATDRRDRERAAFGVFITPTSPRVRAWVETGVGGGPDFATARELADAFAAVREEARREALEEAARLCERDMGAGAEPDDCAREIRASPRRAVRSEV